MTDAQRILVVDDQKDIREVTSMVLSGAGYSVDTAGSGESALAALEETLYDLVLLDINMPGMDGWETLRLIRCDDVMQGVRVAMFSVKGEIRDKVESLQEGAVDYITKPFVVDQFLDRVERVLEKPVGGAR